MKIILLALALTSAAVYADDISKKAKIEEFFKLAGLEQTFSQSMALTTNQLKAGVIQQMFGVNLTPDQLKTMETFQEKVTGLLGDTIGWNAIKADFVVIYAEAFTEKELDDMNTFYKSPAGKAMVAKTPQMMTKASEVTQAKMAIAMPKLQQMMKDFMGSQTSKTEGAPK